MDLCSVSIRGQINKLSDMIAYHFSGMQRIFIVHSFIGLLFDVSPPKGSNIDTR